MNIPESSLIHKIKPMLMKRRKMLKNNMHMLKRLLIVFWLFTNIVTVSNGQSTARDGGLSTHYASMLTGVSSLINGSNLACFDTAANNTGAAKDPSIQNVITFKIIEETTRLIPDSFSASIQLNINYGANAYATTTIPVTLSVSYKPGTGIKYNALQYFSFNNAKYVNVSITNISYTSINNFDPRQVLQLSNEMNVISYYNLASGVVPVLYPAVFTGDALSVQWNWPVNTGNNNCQLEWTWLEDEMAGNYTKSNGDFDTSLLFSNNATRVDISATGNSYSIPMFYDGHGKLFYRIRATNYTSTGTNTYGPWFNANPYIFSGHNDSLNWQVTTSYAEEGKRKTVIQYFDGSLRSRQTVTKDNTTQTTIVAETFYDGEGRSAVQVLPTPTMSNIVQYAHNFNFFNNTSATSNPALAFDLEPINKLPGVSIGHTPILDSSSGASRYYSANNDLLTAGDSLARYIPNASGYAYAVTRYTPDATGRIMSQSGVGSFHQIGSGHETLYYYGTAPQEELDGLFGTEVGDASHYFKNMVSDANGQMSVSYVDMHGRTIATALAGEASSNVQALDIQNSSDYPNQAGSSLTIQLLNKNTNAIRGNSIEAVNSLLVPYSTTYHFNYSLNPQTLQLPGCTANSSLCFDCLYDLTISITDESGNYPPIIRSFSDVKLDSAGNCIQPHLYSVASSSEHTSDTANNTISFTETLQPGSYSIRKTLTMSEASLQQLDSIYQTKINCISYQHILDSVTQSLQNQSACGTSSAKGNACQSCMDTLGTFYDYVAKYEANLSSDQYPTLQQLHAMYSNDSTHCALLCGGGNSSTLTAIKQQMLSDMMPYTGQYARDPDSVVVKNEMYNKYDIFSTNNNSRQPFYKNPYNPNSVGTGTVYFDAVGDTATNILPLSTLTPDTYVQNYDVNWANQLLPYHPEYAKLQFAIQNLTPSYAWIDNFTMNDSIWAQGSTLLDNHGDINGDPFISLASLQLQMDSVMSGTHYRQGLSMWQIAYGNVFCKDITDATQRGSCYHTVSLYPPIGGYSNASTDQMNLIWQYFNAAYTMYRDSLVNRYIEQRVPLGSDADSLVSQGYKLYFPLNDVQTAQQYGWTWYPGTSTNPSSSIDTASFNQTYKSYTSSNVCLNYPPLWKAQLLQCSQLSGKDSATQAVILKEITDRMTAVCMASQNAANPNGASTLPIGASPTSYGDTSFEQIINSVYANHGISADASCTPFAVNFPKAYGQNPSFIPSYIATLDSCTCSRFSTLVNEANVAGYAGGTQNGLNTYLRIMYNDTITASLYSSLTAGCPQLGQIICNESFSQTCDTVTYYSLVQPQPLPQFLQCGYVKTNSCYTCAELNQLAAQFKSTYPSYSSAPQYNNLSNIDSITAVGNALFADFVNAKTGLQYNWQQYAQLVTNAQCTLDGTGGGDSFVACPSGYAVDNLDVQVRSANKPSVYVARSSITLEPGFVSGVNDTLVAYIDPNQNLCTVAGADTINLASLVTGATVFCRSTTTYMTDTAGMNLPLLTDPCNINVQAGKIAQDIYLIQQQQLLKNFDSAYKAKCLNVQNIENFTVTAAVKLYHFTLYYYDMAGNLVKTIPPKGVQPNWNATYIANVEAAKISGTQLLPAHTFATNYRYNSLNQVISQNTPDASTSHSWYDRLGRLVLSQNAKQALSSNYSYTVYDDIGRITQVGQLENAVDMAQFNFTHPDESTYHVTPLTIDYGSYVFTPDIHDMVCENDTLWQQWLYSNLNSKAQITQTVYDVPYTPIYGLRMSQKNLRNRVSYTSYYSTYADMTNLNQQSATYYDYDVHGNVDTLLQDYLGIAGMNNNNGNQNRFKLITYDYDLISGKVNQVNYQPESSDAFYHKYHYDAENRLTEVYTSRDKIYWERDADYQYYKHGPLARSILGQQQVQGLTYAYTLQGWLKAVNADSTINGMVAKNAMGYQLNYFGGDYLGIGANNKVANLTPVASLYNGNIGSMAVNIPGLGSSWQYQYTYDQLNRIIAMDAYKATDNAWHGLQAVDDYKERISYDPNGNIKTYTRNGDAARLQMDNLTYNYQSGNNKLDYVADSDPDVSTNLYSKYNDIKTGQATGNYSYDAIGNLTGDVQQGISNITWTVYGKIASITKTDGTTVNYQYDAAGNRISKLTTKAGVTNGTYYVRDAQGNVLSVYQDGSNTAFTQTEKHLYGSSRLGLSNTLSVADQTVGLPDRTGKITTFTRGEKLFELSNHLGNVLVTVTDKKLQVPDATNTNVAYYTADVASANDYYPFGMAEPGRTYNAGNYRYGFNGKELDKDMDGSNYDYGFRIYNPQIGKFLSTDPLQKQYPYYTPYQFAGNTPVMAKDLDGKEIDWATQLYLWYTSVKLSLSNAGNSVTQHMNNYVSASTNNYGHFDSKKDIGAQIQENQQNAMIAKAQVYADFAEGTEKALNFATLPYLVAAPEFNLISSPFKYAQGDWIGGTFDLAGGALGAYVKTFSITSEFSLNNVSNAYHASLSEDLSWIRGGININRSKNWLGGNRFGKAFYTALDEATPFLESPQSQALAKFDVNLGNSKIFNATSELGTAINKFQIGKYKVGGGLLRSFSDALGYDGILVKSVQNGRGINLNYFNQSKVNSVFTNGQKMDFSLNSLSKYNTQKSVFSLSGN